MIGQGNPPPNRDRNPAIHARILDPHTPNPHIQLGRRARNARHADEVSLQRHVFVVIDDVGFCFIGHVESNDATTDRVYADWWWEGRGWGRGRAGDECAVELA